MTIHALAWVASSFPRIWSLSHKKICIENMDQIFKTKMIVMLWHFHEFSCCNLFGGVPWDEISYGARVAKSIILWSLPLLHDKCKNIDRDGVVNFCLRSWILWNIIHNCENHELFLLPDKGQNHLNGIAQKMFRLKIWRQYHWQCYQTKVSNIAKTRWFGPK